MRTAKFTLLCVALSGIALAQRDKAPQGISSRSITGQVRFEDKVAPQGVLVLLDIAPDRETAPAGAGEVARTMTDSSGRFVFEHLELVGNGGGRELFAVTARYAGFQDAVQVVDLSFTPRGFAQITLQRKTSPASTASAPPGSFLSARQPASAQAQEALAKGQALLIEKHDPQSSIESLKKLVKLDPKYGPGYLLLGTAYMQTQSWLEAQSAFEKAAKVEPGNAEAYLGVGAALNAQQDFAGAQRVLQQSLELNPGSAQAQFELSKSLWAMGRWQEAEPHARRAIEIDKNFPMSHIIMGNIYLRHRDARSALAEFQEYLRLDPEGQQSGAVKEMATKIQKALGQR